MKKLASCVFLFIFFTACKQHVKIERIDVTRNGVLIGYSSCGMGDTTLLFVHGWCINKEYWDQQMEFFCPAYRVVAIDLPGFGESGKNRTTWDFDEYTEDIKAVIEQLKLKNVILIGHSMSGDLILNVSNKYPKLLTGIVGVDNLHEPSGPFTDAELKDYADFFNSLSTAFDSTTSRFMKPYLFQPSTDTAIVNRVMNNVFTADSSIALKVLRSVVVILQKEKQMMQGLAHKLYLVNSAVKPVNADSLNKYCVKGFHAEIVPATSHYPMIETPAEFNDALLKTLQLIGKGE